MREGTLETLLISPASRSGYFIGCLSEQTMRALLEFGTVLAVGSIWYMRMEGKLIESIFG